VRRLLLLATLAVGCATVRPVTDTAITQTGATVLRDRAVEVDAAEIPTPEFQALVARMVDAMRKAPGVGLAAPQLSVNKRVFVLEDKEELMAALNPLERQERERVPVPLRVLVNPVVTPVGDEKVTFFEGCLSVAGFAGMVERWREVEVTALDEKGEPVTWRVRGWPARILQHEMDHLNGVLYVDRMVTRTFGTLPQVKALYGGKPIADVKKALGVEKWRCSCSRCSPPTRTPTASRSTRKASTRRRTTCSRRRSPPTRRTRGPASTTRARSRC
jgi:peptide deformylase